MNKRNILLTGSSGNLGRYLFDHLAINHAVMGIDKNPSDEQLLSVNQVKLDLTDFEAVGNFFLQNENKQFNALINCAGHIQNMLMFNMFAEEKKHSYEVWKQVLDSNLNTTFVCASQFIEDLIKRREPGVIINISSISAKGTKGQSAYSAAKAGVEVLTKVWAEELAPFGIRSVCIAPGYIDVPSTHQNMDDKSIGSITKNTSVGRLGHVDEFISAVEFVLENNFFNGKILSLDGGLFR